MFTNIITKEGKEVSILSQQYEIGVYVIINNNPKLQMSVNGSEKDFHKKLE